MKPIDGTENLDGIHTLVMFIGHAFTGHTAVRAILDAHPHIVISDEWNLASRVQWDDVQDGEDMYRQILHRNAEDWAKVDQQIREQTFSGYPYQMVGLGQGESDGKIKVIGDKRAHDTTTHLVDHIGLLDAIRALTRVERVVLIHVIRNPLDTITTSRKNGGATYEQAAQDYVTMARATERIIRAALRRPNVAVWPIHHGDLLADPIRQVRALLCKLLGDKEADVVGMGDNNQIHCVAEAAAMMLHRKPNRPAEAVDRELREQMKRTLESEPLPQWLDRYTI